MMKKVLLFILVFACVLPADAAIRALGADEGSSALTSDITFSRPNTTLLCQKAGFDKTVCPSGQNAVFPCPYNSEYFKDCCPSDYKYSEAFCREYGMEPSKDSCYELYACLPKKKDSTPSEKGNNGKGHAYGKYKD